MPDALGAALAAPGLVILLGAFAVAGLVRGFAGFGTALIVMPVATIAVPVAEAVALLALSGVASTAALLPRAWREGDRGEVAVLAAPAILAAPLGTYLLMVVPGDALRWAIAVAGGATLAALLTGWRYARRAPAPALAMVGASAGVLGGATGLTGPPVILFYLAGRKAAQGVRANVILFLAALDVGILAALFASGLVGAGVVWLAALVAPVYLAASLAGQAAFRPDRERAFRTVAHAAIGLAILTGLPVWR